MRHRDKDNILISRILSGDEEAFGILYDAYVVDIYRFVFFKVSNQEEAEDLTSEVFLRFWQYLSTQGKKVDNARALLYRIARNAVIDFYRKSGRNSVALDETHADTIEDTSVDLEKDIEIRDEVSRLREIIGKLGASDQELITLRYIEDLSVAEIADVLEKSAGAVRVALHRAIKALKNIIREE